MSRIEQLISDIESYIDAYMINKHENIEPNKLNLRKFCFNNKKLSNDLIKLINEVFYVYWIFK